MINRSYGTVNELCKIETNKMNRNLLIATDCRQSRACLFLRKTRGDMYMHVTHCVTHMLIACKVKNPLHRVVVIGGVRFETTAAYHVTHKWNFL